MDLFEFFKETETLAEKVQRVFEEAWNRIQAANLTDAEKTYLVQQAREKCYLSKDAAAMIETVKAADNKVYDINSKAAMIGGDANGGFVSAETEHGRAYIGSERYYTQDNISLYLDGGYRKEMHLYITLKTQDGKKPRIDGIQTAADIETRVNEEIASIEQIASFAENLKGLQEKRAAAEKMVEEIKSACKGLTDIQQKLGFETGYYSVFKRGTL